MFSRNGFKSASVILLILTLSSVLFYLLKTDLSPLVFYLTLTVLATVLHYYFSREYVLQVRKRLRRSRKQDRNELYDAQLKLAHTRKEALSKDEALAKFSHIIEQSPSSIVITDIDGNIEYVNPRFSEVTGYTFEEVIGQNPRLLKSGELSDAAYIELWQTISSGKTWHGEFHNKRKDGSMFWELAHIAPVKNSQGKITHYFAIKENITETKSIRNQQRIFSKALQSIKDNVLILSLDGSISYCNDAFCKSFGYTQKEITNKNVSILAADNQQVKINEAINYHMPDGWHGEISLKQKSGKQVVVAMSTATILNEDKKPQSVVVVMYDISVDKKIEAMTHKAETLATVQELAGSVSHEFSQPLQALSNYIGLIKMGKLKKEYVEKSELAVKRIAGLVQNLSEITHIQKQDYLNTKIINLKASSRKEEAPKEKRILVVDDEKQILETVTEMLRLAGYTVDGAEDGMDALQQVSKHQYQLIISDINMPRMSGIRLFEKLKSIGYDQAFVFLTGYSLPSEMDKIIDQVDGLLNKPIEMKHLIKITKDIIGESVQPN